MNLSDILDRHARERPQQPAVVRGGRRVTWLRLVALADQCAAKLLEQGVGRGHVVATDLADGIEYLVLLLGLARMGAVAFPVSRASPDAEKQRLLKLARTRWLVTDHDSPALSAVTAVPISSVCNLSQRTAAPAQRAVTTRGFDGDAPLVIISSSGTTGVAKLLVLTHAQLLWRITTRERHIGFTPADRYFSLINLSFNLGRVRCLRALYSGATVVFPDAQRRGNVAAEMRRQRITTTNMMPVAALRLAEQARGTTPLLGDIRLVLGSSPMSVADRERIRTRVAPNLFEVFATTETGPVAVAAPEDHERHPGTVGRLAAEVEVQVTDAAGHLVPAGQAGRIRFRTPNMPTAYLGNRAATARNFRDGWFQPGDVAAVDAQGYVYFHGRTDDVINNQGVKFHPAEVEAVLRTHPAVAEASVIGVPHGRGGQVASAFVVPKARITAKALQDYCRERLAPHKVPWSLRLIATLPRNAAGKVLKTELRSRYAPHRRTGAGDGKGGTGP